MDECLTGSLPRAEKSAGGGVRPKAWGSECPLWSDLAAPERAGGSAAGAGEEGCHDVGGVPVQ
jgi:hypothetical protein